MPPTDKLSKALARSQAQVVASAIAAKSRASQPALTVAKPAQDDLAPSNSPQIDLLKPVSAEKLPARGKGKKAAKTGARGKSDQNCPHSADPLDDDQALWRLFQLPEHPPEVRRLVAPRLPGILKGLLEGASKPGLQGAGDRTTFGKMMGATWAKPAAAQANDNSAAINAIGERISKAISRREAGFRQVPVTLDGTTGREVAEVGPFLDDAPVFKEQVRYPAASTAPISRHARADEGAAVEGEDEEGEAEAIRALTRW